MHPVQSNAYQSARRLEGSLIRHKQLMEMDQSPQDHDKRPGFISGGERNGTWTATVSGNENGGSYSLSYGPGEEPSDTVTFTENSLVKMTTYRGYDGREYMTTSHIDRNDTSNSWEVTRMIDPNSIWDNGDGTIG